MAKLPTRTLIAGALAVLAVFSLGYFLGSLRGKERADFPLFRRSPKPTPTEWQGPTAAPMATRVPEPTMVPTAAEPQPMPTRAPTLFALGGRLTLLTHEQPFDIVVLDVSEPDTCPDGRSKADPGAKLVLLTISTENVGDDYDELPPLVFRLVQDDDEVGVDASPRPCPADEQAWRNACWQMAAGGLWPGVSCQGWLALQVRLGATVEQLAAEAYLADDEDEPLVRWRLGP